MPRDIQGSVFGKPGNYFIKWPENGRRPQQGGFATKTEARQWFDEHVKPRLRHRGPSPQITFNAFCDLYLERWGADRAPKTVAAIRYWLTPARERFGDWPLSDLEGAVEEIIAFKNAIPGTDDWRHKAMRALRQVLAAAVRWRYIHRNPAVDAGPNTQPRAREVQPFTATELDMLREEMSPTDAAIVTLAEQTGLRTSEWVRLERRDIDRHRQVVIVRPETAKTHKPRRVPLTPRAQAAIDQLPAAVPLLITAPGGGPIDLDNWRLRSWYPALEAAGLQKRGVYSLRHTFAARALQAGVSIYELTELMGTSIRMIERHYGHLMPGSEDRLRALLSGEQHGAANR